MPFIMGETTPIIALVAIAASTAFPPRSRIRGHNPFARNHHRAHLRTVLRLPRWAKQSAEQTHECEITESRREDQVWTPAREISNSPARRKLQISPSTLTRDRASGKFAATMTLNRRLDIPSLAAPHFPLSLIGAAAYFR